MNILVVGSGSREHALVKALSKSPQKPSIFCFSPSRNPGIMELTTGYGIGNILLPSEVADFAVENDIELVIVGPEAPLASGVSDELWNRGIPVFGPKKMHAQLESSKSFTRDLLKEYNIEGNPKCKSFDTVDGVADFVTNEIQGEFVIKADGLMGGKGVKVQGDHFADLEEGLKYCENLVQEGSSFLIEEKFVGQEFSLITLCDGENLIHTPAVQDHKRAFDGDKGPNTGGMGTYSDSDHKLPFLTEKDIEEAKQITTKVAKALKDKFNEGYKGVLYGGFIVTKNGVRLIEYNARFGDPEAMNILSVLETDFVKICQDLVSGKLNPEEIKFSNKATVCKYVVPEGYPDSPVKNQEIDVSEVADKDTLFYGSVDLVDGKLVELGSRTIAVTGVAETIEEAEKIAEAEVNRIKGPLFHRKDIGTKELVESRIKMMEGVRG